MKQQVFAKGQFLPIPRIVFTTLSGVDNGAQAYMLFSALWDGWERMRGTGDNPEDWYYHSEKQFCDETGIKTEKTVRKYLNLLEKFKYIKRKKRDGETSYFQPSKMLWKYAEEIDIENVTRENMLKILMNQ